MNKFSVGGRDFSWKGSRISRHYLKSARNLIKKQVFSPKTKEQHQNLIQIEMIQYMSKLPPPQYLNLYTNV